MGFSRLPWLCAALFLVSPVILAAVDVQRTGSAFQLKPSSVSVPSNTALVPRSNTPAISQDGEGLKQRVRADVRASFDSLPTVSVPTGGDLKISREGAATALAARSRSLSSPASAVQNIPAVNTVAQSRGWVVRDDGLLWSGPDDSEVVYEWTPPEAQHVSMAQAISMRDRPDSRTYGGYVRRWTVRVPRGEGNTQPPRPADMPDVGIVRACPVEMTRPADMISCFAIAQSNRSYGTNQWEYSVLFAASHIDVVIDGQEVTMSPWWIGSDLDYMSNSLPGDFLVVYAPSERKEQGVATLITEDELESAILDDYIPQPQDWDEIYNELPPSEPYALEMEEITDYEYSPVVTTERDNETEDTTVTEVTNAASFEYLSNDVPKPALSVDLESRTRQYRNGQLIDDRDVTINYPPGAGGGSSGGGTGGGGSGDGGTTQPGGGGPGDGDLCSWADPLCKFMEWMQEEGDEEDPDLSSIMQDAGDLRRTYTVSFGSAQCPEPLTIDIAFINKQIVIGFDWWCQLAAVIRPFVLLSAYIAAIYITLGLSGGRR